jgi:proteasome lid subunit RPN8/RPN11
VSIQLSRKLYDEMISYSMCSLPNEACGILIQEASFSPTEELHIHTFIPLPNHAAHPTKQFVIHPLDIIPYLADQRRTIVGIFHSPPHSRIYSLCRGPLNALAHHSNLLDPFSTARRET